MSKVKGQPNRFAVPSVGGAAYALFRTGRPKSEALLTFDLGPSDLRLRKSAFTMVELLVVLAIIAVLTTITIPTIDAMTSPKHALRKEGRKVMQLMTRARMTAMSRKVKIDLYVDPETREIGLVESRLFNSPGGEERGFYSSGSDTNRFEKRIVLDEDFSLKPYSEEEEESDEARYAPAVSFLQYGGSNGGGITLIKDEMELSIKADVLTGRAKVVGQKSESQRSQVE